MFSISVSWLSISVLGGSLIGLYLRPQLVVNAPASSSAPVISPNLDTKIDNSLVFVTSTLANNEGLSEGTGMIISSTGEILTNNHVISEATSLTIETPWNSKIYKASLVGYDPVQDLAVLKVSNVKNWTPVSFGSATFGSIGDSVLAIGIWEVMF